MRLTFRRSCYEILRTVGSSLCFYMDSHIDDIIGGGGMTNDEILLLADTEISGSYTVREVNDADLLAFARAIEQRAIEDNRVCYALEPDAVKIGLAVKKSVAIAVAQEREACASLAEQRVALRVAKAIRARGE